MSRRRRLDFIKTAKENSGADMVVCGEQNTETVVPMSPSFSSVVLLAMNLKKSPWLLCRCKQTFNHVSAIQKLIKNSDDLKIIVKLMGSQKYVESDDRYLALISTSNEDNFLLGLNVENNSQITVGLILPITMETDICLDGDGGFFVSNLKKKFSLEPVSIQEMWTALQALVKCIFAARNKNCQHVSVEYYEQLPKSDPYQVCEWERTQDVLSSRINEVVLDESEEDLQLKILIRRKLQEILMSVDLDNVTSKQVRDILEDKLKMNVQEYLGLSLSQYKQFIDEETIVVMRQMDSPSQILDFLYLGSEWNASNLEELKRNRVGYILNVTKEIDNFFPGMFKYCNVRVYDYEEAELLKHWNNTYKFISEAKEKKSNILVHCKMGVSRSASSVIAFLMKNYQWTLEQAYQHVKQKRGCVQPNPGFMKQLITYQGILDASNHRHSRLFRSRSINSIDNFAKNESIIQKARPRSNAEQRHVVVADNDAENIVDECDKSHVTVSDENATPGNTTSDTFVIVEADDNYLNATDTSFSLLDQSDSPILIDDSKLSSSSVLRQWSCHTPDVQPHMENIINIEEVIEEEIFEDSDQNCTQVKKCFSWPCGLDIKVPPATSLVFELQNVPRVVPSKPCVRFTLSGSTNLSKKKKGPMRRFNSMFVE